MIRGFIALVMAVSQPARTNTRRNQADDDSVGRTARRILIVAGGQSQFGATLEAPEDAIAAANRPLYGLTSSILAGDTYRAFEIVNVNSPTVNDEIHAPMGGVRDSGWGRTGPRSLEDFSGVIWITSDSGQRQYLF